MLATLTVNTRVAIQAPGWEQPLPTRVDDVDVDDDLVFVTDPLVPSIQAPAVGTALCMSWPGPFGPRHLSAVLVGVDDGRRPSWRLHAQGPAVAAQRRSHARAITLVDATVTSGGFSVGVQVVDLSEGGVHVVTAAPAPLVAGELVRLGVHLHDAWFDLVANVVRVQEVDGRLHAGCRFVDLSLAGEARLRRFVFRRQGAERARLRS